MFAPLFTELKNISLYSLDKCIHFYFAELKFFFIGPENRETLRNVVLSEAAFSLTLLVCLALTFQK